MSFGKETEREKIIAFMQMLIQNQVSKINLGSPNANWYDLFVRTINVYTSIINNNERIELTDLVRYRDILLNVNIIHDPLQPEMVRANATRALQQGLREIEQKYLKTGVEPIISEEEQVIMAAHTKMDTEVNVDRILQKKEEVESKLDRLYRYFTYTPIDLMFVKRDLDKQPWIKQITSQIRRDIHLKTARENIDDLARMYERINVIYQNLLDYLQKNYSKDVTEEDMNTANELLNKIFVPLSYLDSCRKALRGSELTADTFITKLNKASDQVIRTEAFFDGLFSNDYKR